MGRRGALYTTVGLVILAAAACDGRRSQQSLGDATGELSATPGVAPAKAEVGPALYAAPAATQEAPAPRPRGDAVVADPILVPDCRLLVIDKQEVPAQKGGVLVLIGTDIQPGEKVPPDRVVTVNVGGEEKKFRRLQEGDVVRADQLLAQLDDRVARDERAIKRAKLESNKADLASAEKTCDEAKSRYLRRQRLLATVQGSTTAEEVDQTKLMWQRYAYEAISKRAAIALAESELSEAETTLKMHEIRSAIPAVIKTIYKKRGEFVKDAEPVFQLNDIARLRIEALVPMQYLDRLHPGMQIGVDLSRSVGPLQTLIGHLHEVTGVAVSRDAKNPLIVSASDDGTVRVWDRLARRERRILWHPTPVKAVACSPAGAPGNWCLSGGEDGSVRLWDLDAPGDQPPRVFKDRHRQAVRCVAFSPDGKACATGGEDLEICLWDPATGALRYRLPAAHRAAVTSLQFTPQCRLVSAGGDNTLRLWTLGEQGARLEKTFDRRSGDVGQLGVSPDGKRTLFDQGKKLRLLSLPEGLTDGVLQNLASAANFNTFALFSPDARLILTAGASDGRLQLWRAPTEATRARELSQLIPVEPAPATCAAFAPDGSFLVTGTRERQVLVWPVPDPQPAAPRLHAGVTLVERLVESSAGQVRLWAELPNPDGRLLPGTAVTVVIDGD